MARKTTTAHAPQAPAKLKVPRNLAREQLNSRHTLGEDLRKRSINSPDELDNAERDFDKWSDYNREMLRRMFDNDEYATEYNSAFPMVGLSYGERSLNEKVQNQLKYVVHKLDFLESLAGRLDLIDEVEGIGSEAGAVTQGRTRTPTITNDVFVVHGHDEEMKSIVARFLDKCRLNPIILSEQSDQGRTIIEKFEQSSDVGFAVILLSPDDVGGLARDLVDPSALQGRARQNVILELGYFVGKLGRGRVCALRKGEVELPSDFSGVIYTPFGSDDSWKMKLARELKVAGVEIDLNVALA